MSGKWVVAAAAAVLAAAGSASAADVAGPMKLSSAEVAEMVAKTTNGTASHPLPLGDKGPIVIAAHRVKTGDAEVHDGLNDVFVVRSGSAAVLVGGKIEGARLTTPGEWRGGVITGAQTFQLAPGDVLWIPAGLPHQVIVPAGGDFGYFAFKSPK